MLPTAAFSKQSPVKFEEIQADFAQVSPNAEAGNEDFDIKSLFLQAQESENAGELEKSALIYQKVLAKPGLSDEWDVLASYALAGVYFEQKKVEQGRALLSKIIANPQAEAFYRNTSQLALAGTYQQAKEYDRARKELNVLAEDSKVDPSIRFVAQAQIGATFSNQEKWEQARVAYNQALDIKDVPLLQRAGAMSQIVQTYEKQFGRARALDEVAQFHTPLLQEAQRLFDAKQWEPARDYYAALIAVGYWNPSVVWGFQEQIAETYLEQKDWEESRKLLDAILGAQPDPNWPERERAGLKLVQQLAQSTLAQSYLKEGNNEQAKAEFQKLLQMPNLNEGLRAKAEAALKQLGAIAPATPQTL